MQKVDFVSENCRLVGTIRFPESDSNEKLPAVIIIPSWTNVKEQFASIYAIRLASEGFVTLCFDFRYYGESEGTPRNYENPLAKIQDIKNAISYLEGLGNVDPNEIHLLGVCAGAGYAAVTASSDSRIKKLAMIASWIHDEAAVRDIYGGEAGIHKKIDDARAAHEKFNLLGLTETVPKVSTTDPDAAMYGPFSYYLDPERGAIREWDSDHFAIASWDKWLNFTPLPAANEVTCPLLMIHSDEAVLPQYAKNFFDRAASLNKQLHWTEGTQFDFYDQDKQVSEAVLLVNDFFKKGDKLIHKDR